jgi:hypothetical protein
MERPKIWDFPPPIGFFVYSSCGCGDESAIHLTHIEDCEKPFEVGLSPAQARKLGKLLIDTAVNYENGIETGIYFEGK